MVSRKLCLKQVKNFTFLILLRLISLFVFFSKPLSIVHNLMVCTTQHITALLDCLKELCDEIPLKMWKEALNYIANTKEGSQGIRHWWTNMETIEADWNYGFWKLASQTVFQSSLVLFCNVWYGDWETYLFDKKLWFSHPQVISQVQSKANTDTWLAL